MRPRVQLGSETGSSLITVLLLMMVVSGLVAAMVSSSMTDTMVSRNHHSGAQAQAAAEAGLNHAIDAARTFLRDWDSNLDNTQQAVSRLLRGPDNDALTLGDNGSLNPDASAPTPWMLNGTPLWPATLPLAGVTGVTYRARVFDDDDPALAAVPADVWDHADLMRNDEGMLPAGATSRVPTPYEDKNGYFVVRATGFAAGNSEVTVEALMKPMPWPAIVTNGDLLFAGTPQVLGDGGSVHSNGNLEVQNGACTITQDVTSVGGMNVPGGWTPVQGIAEGGQLPISLPPVNVADFLSQANYRLGNDGAVYRVSDNALLCRGTNVAPKCSTIGLDWSYSTHEISGASSGITGTWDLNNNHNCASVEAAGFPNCAQGVYYAQTSDVTISGSVGSHANPYALTLLVDGSIRISGSPVLTRAITNPSLIFVAHGDLQMTGTANCELHGQARIREQFELGGNMTLYGQILVRDEVDICDVANQNRMYGNATVFNDRLSVYDFAVAGWREFRR